MPRRAPGRRPCEGAAARRFDDRRRPSRRGFRAASRRSCLRRRRVGFADEPRAPRAFMPPRSSERADGAERVGVRRAACRAAAARCAGNALRCPTCGATSAGSPSNASSQTRSGVDDAHRPELLERVLANESIDFADLGVGQPRVRLGERHQRAVVPHAEGVVGIEARPAAVPRCAYISTASTVYGSIFHFHHGPRTRPTP